MKLQKANNLFINLLKEEINSSEIRIYTRFNEIFSSLSTMDLTEEKIQSIETKLESLNLNSEPKNKKKFYGKALKTLEKFLNESFSIISKGFYTNLGIAIGTNFGLLFGLIVLDLERSMGVVIGLCGGMVLGIIIGKSLDEKAVKEGRVI